MSDVIGLSSIRHGRALISSVPPTACISTVDRARSLNSMTPHPLANESRNGRDADDFVTVGGIAYPINDAGGAMPAMRLPMGQI